MGPSFTVQAHFEPEIDVSHIGQTAAFFLKLLSSYICDGCYSSLFSSNHVPFFKLALDTPGYSKKVFK